MTGSTGEIAAIFGVHAEACKAQRENRLAWMARQLHFTPEQLICALAFNPRVLQLTEIAGLLDYSPSELINRRDEIFSHDIYRKVSLDNILTIYGVIKAQPETIQAVQNLLPTRLGKIESEIESTVNSTLIEKYKAEMRAVYMDGIASIDFAENRLACTDSGFRALINEVVIITESRLIPAGDIFFRDTVLPEEKRKLLSKGLIPADLVAARLEDQQISPREKKILTDFLSGLNRLDKTGAQNS